MSVPRNHEIIERYCSHVDDNVIMIKKRTEKDKYICLSSHRCRHLHPHGCERADAEPEDECGGKA